MSIRATKIMLSILVFLFLGKTLFFNRLLPQNSSFVDYVLWFGFGICISIISAGYSYHAWIMDNKRFMDWYASQKLYPWQGASVYLYPEFDTFRLWINRVFGPLGFLLGFVLVCVTLFIAISV